MRRVPILPRWSSPASFLSLTQYRAFEAHTAPVRRDGVRSGVGNKRPAAAASAVAGADDGIGSLAHGGATAAALVLLCCASGVMGALTRGAAVARGVGDGARLTLVGGAAVLGADVATAAANAAGDNALKEIAFAPKHADGDGDGDTYVSLASCAPLDSALPPYNTTATEGVDAFAYGGLQPGGWSYFPDPIARTAAHNAKWRVHYFNTWKFVQNLAVGQQYVLSMRGTNPPLAAALRAGANLTLPDGDVVTIADGLRWFTVPVRRLCVEETVGLAFVELLGLRQHLTRVNEADAQPTSACVLAMDVPPLESEYAYPFNATLRRLEVDQSCDLVLGSNDAGPAGEVQHASFASTAEADVLSRAEWLRFIALFFNRETAANAIFNGIAARFAATKALVDAQYSGSSAARPLVAWVSTYAGSYSVSGAAYKANLTRDAGGAIWSPAITSYSSQSAFLTALRAARPAVVVDETYAYDPRTYNFTNFLSAFGFSAADMADLPFLAHARVYRYDGLMSAGLSLDWFEDSIPNADALLSDFASVLALLSPNPSADLTNHTEIWLRNIGTGDAPRIISGTCTAADMQQPLSAHEAEEAGPAHDPAMVSACPAYLQQPWTWMTAVPDDGNGKDTKWIVAVVVVAAVLVFAGVAVVAWKCRRGGKSGDEQLRVNSGSSDYHTTTAASPTQSHGVTMAESQV